MSKIIKYITMFSLSVILVTSCTKDFDEYSKNPNASEEALPQALLAPALKNVLTANMNRCRSINNELMQVTVLMGDTEGRVFRYDIRKAICDYLWNSWFVQLNNFKDMYSTAETLYTVESDKSYNTYMGISLICQSWVCSLLTDTYGDMPYTEASQGRDGLYTPKFDRQEDIYMDIFAKLEQANALLADGIDLPEDQAESDPIFSGSASKWRKFGNSLYLRLLLRTSAKREDAAKEQFIKMLETEAASYPIMTSNSESAVLRWTGAAPYLSPFNSMRDSDWRQYVLAHFFLENLNNWNDPRRPLWASTSGGEYAGVESGYAVGAEVTSRSRLPYELRTEPLLGTMMNYAEVQFALAEIAAKGYITSDASTYYQRGIEAAITYWGKTVPDGYMDNPRVAWDTEADLDGKMEKIHLQKYYALFYTDLQQWFECRRTGFPILPKGAGLLNNKELPSRLYYPVYLQATNGKNYFEAVERMGGDELYTRVWWQSDNVGE